MLKMFSQLGTPASQKYKIAIPNAGNHVIGSFITSKDVAGAQKAMNGFIKNRQSSLSK